MFVFVLILALLWLPKATSGPIQNTWQKGVDHCFYSAFVQRLAFCRRVIRQEGELL